MTQERFQILSIDGGGIRGLFSAAVLAHLEDDLDIRVTDHFDLIVGTSTGGIIALALALGFTPREVVEFYTERGEDIFVRGCGIELWKRFQNYFYRKFSAKGLENALRDTVKEATLGDCQKRVVIPAYNLDQNDVYLFKTPHHERLRRDWKVPVWKVARATSAAPTYFSAFRGVDSVRLVDGGIWANNPCMVGIVEAMSLLSVPASSIKLLSLGTLDEVSCPPANLDDAGKLQWAPHVANTFLCGQARGAFAQARHILADGNVHRADALVPPGLFALDKLTPKEHLGCAAHLSRTFAPSFAEHFKSHKAPEFKPLYGPRADPRDYVEASQSGEPS